MEKKKTLREVLTKEVIISIKGDKDFYNNLIWQLIEEGLKKWTIQELREFLGVDCNMKRNK